MSNRTQGALVAGFLALAATLVAVDPADAQSARIDDDGFVAVNSTGADSSRLTDTGLVLGGLNAGDPRLTVLDDNAGDVFDVDALSSLTGVTHLLYVRRNNGVSTARIDGAVGNLSLGGDGFDGDVELKDANFNTTITLDGDTGDARTSLAGDGFVKGWARIASDGSVLSCYMCDPAKTVLIPPDVYLVDFSPLGSDISSRPALVTINGPEGPVVSTVPDVTLLSRVRVQPSAATDFTLMLF